MQLSRLEFPRPCAPLRQRDWGVIEDMDKAQLCTCDFNLKPALDPKERHVSVPPVSTLPHRLRPLAAPAGAQCPEPRVPSPPGGHLTGRPPAPAPGGGGGGRGRGGAGGEERGAGAARSLPPPGCGWAGLGWARAGGGGAFAVAGSGGPGGRQAGGWEAAAAPRSPRCPG